MTLANLLASGKSFFSGHGSIAYRQNRRAYVPQFTSDKNPFLPRAGVGQKTAVPPAVPLATAAGQARPTRVPKWAGKLNPFRTPAPERTFSRAEQPELSLQTLKPVQNDLLDSDIERVPAKSQTLPPAPVKSTASAWELVNAS